VLVATNCVKARNSRGFHEQRAKLPRCARPLCRKRGMKPPSVASAPPGVAFRRWLVLQCVFMILPSEQILLVGSTKRDRGVPVWEYELVRCEGLSLWRR
jgi:hypothetical protein